MRMSPKIKYYLKIIEISEDNQWLPKILIIGINNRSKLIEKNSEQYCTALLLRAVFHAL
jgi:hypothetical protein